MTYSEADNVVLHVDEYNALQARADTAEGRVADLQEALRQIRQNALTDDDGAWSDPYSSLERILDITTDLKAEELI